ncbi:FdhF/YdeP family oxidoreductase [Tuwongella immobilis]|uniref:Molybdopterin oxidoreductase domain-containing protein n=1 Tax=Tuwongella immobilis TaxID=692036 RepID=A0A6C2YTB0_9BACT|nr:FdhF/YdeP family oxidoreductase [Tuwongella immobilis]VIP04621.1 oxidoreductase alpha subunit : Putative formate dehydrogenase oxidoreductase protein OS=Cystobacter fuscus DSM 2262 GN=D187_004463 PE=4 SV=1: Molybdopterin: Molydop_binding [Tuwongella immobilis]VTS06603.1 oxidoreductase alpha subunit : Putative formate dehydrogenase oxidoreductase protein OS=Cystobacter fuscus DSM 2262 GN=D187_004463 PE=4 SV=1: Molybdopterin: Molydop_binding [Tuwongella immobilis]
MSNKPHSPTIPLDPARESSAPRAVPPETFTGLEISEPHTTAAGIPAVVNSMDHVFRQMGLLRGARALTLLNQSGGIDCMSCAWPDPDSHRSSAEFCENGAKAVAWEGDTRKCGPEFFRAWSISALAEQSDYWHGQQGRLTQPMILRPGTQHYAPIEWDAAFELIAAHLNALATPDEAIFYTSGRTSNEAAFLYQLFVRQFGTNNLPDCSNMCHESSGVALGESIGLGKGTVTLDDIHDTDVLVIIGQNPGTNHPRMLTSLQVAKERGAKIIAINPLPEAGFIRFKHPQRVGDLLGSGTALMDLFLQVKIGGDEALLKGIGKALLEREASAPGSVVDRGFIAEQTAGWDAYEASLRDADWGTLVDQSGVSESEIRQAAELLAGTSRFITCWAMGLTQHPNSVAIIQEIANIHLMRGAIGKPGAGLCPVRGHSNVQGDRTMGIYEKPSEQFLNRLAASFDFQPPRAPGFDTVEAIQAMHDGKGKVFFALGGNFLSATPDTEFTAAALRRCQLTVHVSTKLNRSHLVTGETALILPCLGRTEIDDQASGPQLVTCENSMGVVQTSQGRLSPASGYLLSEIAIVCRLARATLGATNPVDWEGFTDNYDRIRDAIERTIPGFDRYNERVRHKGGFYLPNGPREGRFTTVSGKAQFTTHELPIRRLNPGELVMMTIRTHDQFNTTIYGLDDRYRGIHNERRVILMHADDIAERGLSAGTVVDIHSHFDGVRRTAIRLIVVPYAIPRGNVATYFPETNVLVPLHSTAKRSNTPTSKFVIVTVEPSANPVPTTAND